MFNGFLILTCITPFTMRALASVDTLPELASHWTVADCYLVGWQPVVLAHKTTPPK